MFRTNKQINSYIIDTDVSCQYFHILPLFWLQCLFLGTSENTLILIHGFPTSSFDYFEIIDSLSEDYRVVVFDHIGFGFSDKPTNYTYSLVDQAEQALALWRHLAIRYILNKQVIWHSSKLAKMEKNWYANLWASWLIRIIPFKTRTLKFVVKQWSLFLCLKNLLLTNCLLAKFWAIK